MELWHSLLRVDWHSLERIYGIVCSGLYTASKNYFIETLGNLELVNLMYNVKRKLR